MAHDDVIGTGPGARSRAAKLAGAIRPPSASTDRISVAILADMLDEGWVSMDLIADVLVRELPLQTVCAVSPHLVRPRLVPVIRRVRRGSNDGGTTADRVFNRFWLYRRALVGLSRRCDAFHIVDHSYAHLALALPRGRAIVTCHDTDTFRGFLTSGTIDTGLPAFLVRRLAAGLRRAAVVACPSRGTADDVIAAGLADAARVVVVPNGVDPIPADANAECELAPVLAAASPTIDILHVGSTIPRKRIDLLLESFARIVRRWPTARLLRVGGPLTADQQALAARLDIADRVLTLPFLSRGALRAVYERSTLLLLTSDREGFGLPVIEAMSAGLPTVLRDLPVLREVAGNAAVFVDGTDAGEWAAAIGRLLEERAASPEAWAGRCEAAAAQARRFSWARYAEQMAAIYASVVAPAAAGSGLRIRPQAR